MTTNTEQMLREAASEALLTLDGIADTNPRDRADFENKDEWITWAKSRAKWAADKLRAPISRELLAERVLKQMLEQDAALTQPAKAAQAGEAVYQCQGADGRWTDQSRDSYDYNVKHGGGPVRVLYTSPPASQERAQHPTPRMVPIDALLSAESERDCWRTRAQTMIDHANGEFWGWQGDGEDHLESLANSLPVVIRADQLRELQAQQPSGGEVALHGKRVRVAEVVSSADPRKTVPWLAHGDAEASTVESHRDFVRWLDVATPKPEPMTDEQLAAINPYRYSGSTRVVWSNGFRAAERRYGITKGAAHG